MAQQRKRPYRYRETNPDEAWISLKLARQTLKAFKNENDVIVHYETLPMTSYSPDELELIREFWNTLIDHTHTILKERYPDELPDKFRYRALPDGIEIQE